MAAQLTAKPPGLGRGRLRDPVGHAPDHHQAASDAHVGHRLPWSDPGLAMIEQLTGRTGEVDLLHVHEPGEKWTYGAGPKVLGDVIEKLSGQSEETISISPKLEISVFGNPAPYVDSLDKTTSAPLESANIRVL